MHFLEKLKDFCRLNPQRVVFAEAADERILKAARFLNDEQLAEPFLLGGQYEIRDLSSKINVSTRGLKIINPKHKLSLEPYMDAYLTENNKSVSHYKAEKIIENPINHSLMRLKCGHADIAFAGNASTMAAVTRSGLKISGKAKNFERVSSFYIMISPDQRDIYAFADCSINIEPSADHLAEIAKNTAQSYHIITGRKPRITFLSFSTKGSADHEKVKRVKEAVEILKKNVPDLLCDGELQFDASVNSLIAQKKAPNGSLNGKANVFIFPSLNAANIGQKIAEHVAGYLSIGPMILGLNHHVHHLAKSCTVAGIINSTLLASYIKQNMH